MESAVAVIGLGASGEAAARLTLQRGGEAYVSDLRSDPRTSARADRLRELGAVVELGTHDLARILAADLVVASPGIPPDAPVLRSLAERGRAWISEPEFAFRFFEGPLIAVTGTNGKTTTATLVAHLLERSGIDAALGGNVGAGMAPAASELALRERPPEWYVLELSSFQLAGIERLRADVGVVTTLSPDHLDRYPSVGAYYADKARLFRNATDGSRWVLNADVPEVVALPGRAAGERYYFSGRDAEDAARGEDGRTSGAEQDGSGADTGTAPPGEGFRGGFLRGDRLVLAGVGPTAERAEEELVRIDELSLLGAHNISNALAAAVAARLAGAGPDGIRSGLRTFPALPNRLEPVVERDGVLWINDSKATNVAAARTAVEGVRRPLVVLLGGKDKGEDLRPLAEALQGRARLAVLLGEARHRLEEALEGRVETLRIDGSFEDAVAAAAEAAEPGDALLLAPACSSFDMFPDYAARGARFSSLARREER